MYKEDKDKILKYLFPNEELREFLCDNLFLDLSKEIKVQNCISPKNFNIETRTENKSIIISKIQEHINTKNYHVQIKKFYNCDFDGAVKYILPAFVYYLTQFNFKYSGVDIFKDKRSVCYSPVSSIDIL